MSSLSFFGLTLVLCLSLLPGKAAGVVYSNTTTNSSAAVSLNILTKSGLKNDTAPSLYGWMFEDINHSGDGGIYGELLVNRAFEGSNINWGSTPDYAGNSIVYQENPAEAFGTYESRVKTSAKWYRSCPHRIQIFRQRQVAS